MSRSEFIAVLHKSKVEAVRLLVRERVRQWLEDGPEEVTRCVTLRETEPGRRIMTTWSSSDLIEEAVTLGVIDED